MLAGLHMINGLVNREGLNKFAHSSIDKLKVLSRHEATDGS